MNPLERRVREWVERRGSVPFSEVMDLALNDPDHGFYATTGSAGGYRGDFVTSPEVGPLFGAVIARALDQWWRDAGESDPFVVVEAGAGSGTLARTVLAAAPACAPALRYVLVERSAALREKHADYLILESPAHAFAPKRQRSTGPIVVSLAELPRLDGGAVVVANELLDNLPFDFTDAQVGSSADGLTFVNVPGTPPMAPVQGAASEWVREARALAADGGRVVVFDYCVDRTADAKVRTYKGHERGNDPLIDLGSRDITCDVALDQLAPPPHKVTPQADWLRAYGIGELVEEGHRVWKERAAIGDLVAVTARSRINEAKALTDPAGLGAFRVLEWW